MALSTIVVVAVLVVAVFSIDVIASVYSRHCGAPLDDIDGRIGVNHALKYLQVTNGAQSSCLSVCVWVQPVDVMRQQPF